MEDEKKLTVTEALFVFPAAVVVVAGLFVLMLPFTVLSAWIRLQVWEWFAVPYLHLPHLTLWSMFGVGVLIGLFRTHEWNRDDKKSTSSIFSNMAIELSLEFMALGVGYAVYHWILARG